MAIERCAVLGAGLMGAGIAAHLANAGFPVLLLDMEQRAAAAIDKLNAKRRFQLDNRL